MRVCVYSRSEYIYKDIYKEYVGIYRRGTNYKLPEIDGGVILCEILLI